MKSLMKDLVNMGLLSVLFFMGILGVLSLINAQSSGSHVADEETPSGLIDGTNALFTLAHPPSPASSVKLYRNGLRLKQCSTCDYLVGANRIHFKGDSAFAL